MSDIGKAYVQIIPEASGISGKMEQILGGEGEKGGAAFNKGFGSVIGGAGKVIAGAVAAGTAAVGGFAAASVSAGADFDAAMAQVGATMLKTTDEMEKEIGSVDTSFGTFNGNLREFAQFLGQNTAFSATEAAEALNYMALAGYDTQQSMEMLPNVLSLAAAGGFDLARASDMITDTQTAFGLSAERTTQMVDEMAKAASTGNTSVEQLGDAFLVVGGLAKELNGGMITMKDGTQKSVDGVQELEIALTAMANAGVKGNEAGTHMRNMLLKLSSPTEKGAQVLDQLGVSIFDASGNMRSLSDIFGDMSESMGQLTQEDKLFAISKIFNTRDIASAEAMLAAVEADWDGIGESILNAEGSAAEMAEIQLDNLEGDITLFNSALESAKITVSDQLTPTLRDFVQFGTDGLSELTTAFQEGGLEGAMDAFGTILSDGLAMVIEKLPEFVNAGMQLLESLGQGILDNLPLIIDSALEITMTLLDALLENLPTIVEAGLEVITQLALGIAEALPELVPTIVDCVLNIVDVLIENAPMLLEAAMALIEGLAEGLITALPQLIERLPELIEAMVSFLVEHIPEILVFAVELIVQLAAALIENIPTLIAAIPEIILALVNGLLEGIAQIVEVGAELVNGLWEGIKGAWDKLVSNVTALGKKLVDKVKGFFEIGSPSKLFADEIGQWIPEGVAVGIEANADSVNEAVDDMVKGAMVDSDFEMMTKTADAMTPSIASGVILPGNNADVVQMLSEYLPMLLTAIENSGVELSADAHGIFNLVRNENNRYRKANGVGALA